MHPPSSVHVLQAKVTVNQQKFISFTIRRIHHVTFTSPTWSRLRKRRPFVGRSRDRCGIKSSHTCLAMCARVNIGLLWCVGSGSIVAIPSDTPRSIELWVCDWPIAETSSWQHNNHQETHPCPWQGSNPQHSKQADTDLHLRLWNYWDWPSWDLIDAKYILGLSFIVPLCDNLKCLFVNCVQKCWLHKSHGLPVIGIL
jgi:hypothetical protein